jgi:hypothetical protein
VESSIAGFSAAFLPATSKAHAHWYSVKSVIEGVPRLAETLGVSNDSLYKIMSSSAFGWILKGGGFILFADKFKTFLASVSTQLSR